MGKRGRRRKVRRQLQSRRGHASRKTQSQQSALKEDERGHEASVVEDGVEAKWTNLSVKEILYVFGTAIFLVGIVPSITDTLDVTDRIIAGYRHFYASVWRTLFAWLPNWVKPFDAQQTFDALTAIGLVLAATVGKKTTSRKYELYDGAALAILAGIFQVVTIRLFERTWADIAATTTVNLTLIICCLIISSIVEFRLNLSKERRRDIQLLIGIFVSGTLLCMLMDSPRLVWGVIWDVLPSDFTGEVGKLRNVVATAFILTIAAVGVAVRYAVHRPKRPIIAITLAVAMVIWGMSVAGGVIETALRDSGIIEQEAD